MLRLLSASVGTFVLFANPAFAQFDCNQINVVNCPSMFKEKCQDKEFRDANVDACFAAITEASSDAAYCAGEQAALCTPREDCEKLDSPVERHFCKAGAANCDTNIPGLLERYNDVLARLDNSLAKYSDLTSLDLNKADSIDVLCKYQIEQLQTLRSQAETELETFGQAEGRTSAIDQCSSTMQTFIDAGAPSGLNEELWDQIARKLRDGMTEIQGKQGQIQTTIENLKKAPEKLGSLKVAYELVCPK